MDRNEINGNWYDLNTTLTNLKLFYDLKETKRFKGIFYGTSNSISICILKIKDFEIVLNKNGTWDLK